MSEQLNNRVKSATKWSAITEILARLIAPISNIVLARLLTPEAFGVVATITMLVSFAEIFADAGFQKYLIQHEFSSEKEKNDTTNVAFWSNLVVSLLLWIIIALFSEPLATLVGNPGLGIVLIIACASIPLVALSSIQMALYKRNFDYKTLFKVKIVGVLIPLLVTIPLALLLRSFWALIIGTIIKDLVNSLILTYYSKWKPQLFYSITKLKEMLSFSIWSLVETLSIWLTGYADVFIVGTVLSQYYLGLYKTASTVVGQVMGLITAATTPILFASLSRLQNNNEEFKCFFLKFQKMVALLIIPLGIGIFCFRDLVTELLLGKQWLEAANFIGLWGLTSSISIVLSHYASEVFRAKGKPKISVIAQWLHLVVLLPAVCVSVKYGFETLYITRSLVRLEAVLVNVLFIYYIARITPFVLLKNIFLPSIASLIMGFMIYYLRCINDSYIWSFVVAFIGTVVYVGIISISSDYRSIIIKIVRRK